MFPLIATQTFADVVAAPNFFDGNMTTRYGSSYQKEIIVGKKCITNTNTKINFSLVVGYVFVKQK